MQVYYRNYGAFERMINDRAQGILYQLLRPGPSSDSSNIHVSVNGDLTGL